MYTLQIQLRYTVAIAERLSKWSKSKVEAEVKQLFRDMKVPNLGILGKINLELGERLVVVQCRAKRHSSLYHDFSTLKEAFSEGKFAEIWEKKGIVSIQLKEKNDGLPAGNHPTKWVYSAVARDSPVKPERESLSVPAAATCATSASAAPGAGPRRFACASEISSDTTYPSSLSEPSLSLPGHSLSHLNPLPPSSAMQQSSARANAVEDAVDCGSPDKRLPSYSSSAGGIPMSSAPMPSGTRYDYDAPLPTTTSSPPNASTAPINRQPVPPLPSRRRRHRPTTDVTVNRNPPLPDLSLPHLPVHDAMVCGESNAGETSSNTNEEPELMTVTSPPYIPSSPPYIPSSPPYRPTTPRINVAAIDSRRTTRPSESDDLLKASPPIMSKRPLSPSSSSSLGKRRAEEAWAPSQGYNRDDDGDDGMSCDVDADPFSSESEQSAFVSSWLNPQPSTFSFPPPISRQASGSSSNSSSSSSSSTMPPAVDVSRLTIKRPRQYANSSTEEEESAESGKSFLESRKAKRTGAPARARRTTTTKPYDQAKRTSKSRKQDFSAQSDNDDGSTSSSSDSSSSSTSPQRSASKSKSNPALGQVDSDSEATVVTTSTIQMNPGLSDAELLTAWREAGGRLFESIQELIDVKKMIYHGIGERLIEERKRECGHCKNDFEQDLRKLGRKLLRQEYKRLSRLL